MIKLKCTLLSKNLTQISRFVNVLKTNFTDVSVVFNESRALEMILKLKPDFIILDSISAQHTPLLVRAIKAQTLLQKSPVFVITKSDTCEAGFAALREGAADYISYNVTIEEFYLRIKARLSLIIENVNQQEEKFLEFKTIYPLEDREILLACERHLTSHLEEIKTAANLSYVIDQKERKITSIFKQHLGITPAEYIRHKKTLKAKDLMMTTRLTMNEIAAEVGYSSGANFSTAFKHVEGITPKTFKANNLKLISQLEDTQHPS